jgi:hypothetical protein
VFRGRRRWRHVLAMIIGAAALTLGAAVLAARLAHHGTPGLPSTAPEQDCMPPERWPSAGARPAGSPPGWRPGSRPS